MLFSNGASFGDLPSSDAQKTFQLKLLQMQIHLEDTFATLAHLTMKPSVLLCDRGLMDGSAYVPAEEWERVLDESSLDAVTARDQRYNAVFHLQTAAEGAEAFYTLENNSIRSETPEVARDLDRNVLKAWIGHPKLFVFANDNCDFETKLQKVVSTVAQLVGLPILEKKTRRFRLKRCPTAEEMVGVHCETFDVEKVYLRSNTDSPQNYTFLRRRGQQAVASYGQTTVSVKADGQKVEVKRIITAREYSTAVKQRADPSRFVVRQRRISFLHENRYFEIYLYLEPEPGLCLMHLQNQGPEDIIFPSWVEVDEEVGERFDTTAYKNTHPTVNTLHFLDLLLGEAANDDLREQVS